MPVSATPLAATLRLVVQTGTTSQGQPTYQNRDFKAVKPQAADEDIFTVAQSLAGLMQPPVNKIERITTDQLIQA
ncbi:MAG: DUF1659 domain-containing protein [Heliobacteriaceae bacterium]|nr:DUF1659 domain-containing protein [Heliobacteriaceae bacterium]